MDLALKVCLCSGLCVTELPHHVIVARPHQNASEHVDNRCKDLRANLVTFAKGSGSKQVLTYWNACYGAPEACNLSPADPECFRARKNC